MINTDIVWLKKPCTAVPEKDRTLEIASALFAELEAESMDLKRLGVAANQIGINARMFVIKRNGLPPICLISPSIQKSKGTVVGFETCLSLPGVSIRVKRPYQIKVKALNQYHVPVSYRFKGQESKIVCHEIDHLNGILITDRKKQDEQAKVQDI